MKRTALSITLALAVACSGNVFAQIPVTDIAQNAQTIANQVANIAQYMEQVATLKQQVTQQEQQYAALTGSRNLGDIFNDPKYRQYLPADWQQVYDSVRNGGYSGLTGTARTVFEKNHVYDACQSMRNPAQNAACEAAAVKPSIDQGMAQDAYQAATDRLDQIDQLSRQINSTEDPKAIAELQGRIATEQAAIQNEQTKLQLYQMIADAQDKIQDQKQNELNAKTWASRGGISAEAPTFGRSN